MGNKYENLIIRKETPSRGVEKTVQVNFLLPDHLRTQLRIRAAREGRTMSEILTELVRDWVES